MKKVGVAHYDPQIRPVVIIDMMEDLDPKTPIGELFARGPIEVMVTDIHGAEVKLGFTADPRFLILREERRMLLKNRDSSPPNGGSE